MGKQGATLPRREALGYDWMIMPQEKYKAHSQQVTIILLTP